MGAMRLSLQCARCTQSISHTKPHSNWPSPNFSHTKVIVPFSFLPIVGGRGGVFPLSSLPTSNSDSEPAETWIPQHSLRRLKEVESPVAPRADRRLVELEAHGDVRSDYYYWLRDDKRKDPDVLAYLEAENNYTKAALGTEEAEEILFEEMKNRILEVDQSAPYRLGSHFYYIQTFQGQQARRVLRRKVPETMGPPSIRDEMDISFPEEVVHDGQKEVSKHPFYNVKGLVVSDDEKWAAFGEDVSGQERYIMHIKDISSGEDIISPIPNTNGNYEFSSDTKSIFYATVDEVSRPDKIWRHDIGSKGNDTLIHFEKDPKFWTGLERTNDKKYIMISAANAVTSESLYLDPLDRGSELKSVLGRTEKVRYTVEHRHGYFYITILDDKRPKGEIVIAPVSDPTQQQVIVPYDPEVEIESHYTKKGFLQVQARKDGLSNIVLYKLPDEGINPGNIGKAHKISIEDAAYKLQFGDDSDFSSDLVRLHLSSMTRPPTVIDYDMISGQRSIKKVQTVKGGFDKSLYKTERLTAEGHDGVEIPISLVYRPDMVKLDGSSPLVLSVYGAYQISVDPHFSSERLSLIDRGFTFAIAHVRGGGALGREWYETGKFLKKKNTFLDVISCAEYLIANGYTSPEKLTLAGGSAGGLTAGAAMNMRPDLFKTVILEVPFVDVLTSMLDESIPLTSLEYEEWGNPADPEFYWYIKSYSPIDNIREVEYPNLLVTAGLFDPRVGYWEPAKFVAKMRHMKTGDNVLVLKTNMDAGHVSLTGKFGVLKEEAVKLAFLLKMNGVDVY
ncbi:hypothetical protein BSKO_03283 [Bryopsis sp. KO-2023]|nr:hypothetical protein BSKO_03283 [Bryopsis sp. KO-2023]